MIKVISFYKIYCVKDLEATKIAHREILASVRGKGRIYISKEGVNGQVSVSLSCVERYIKSINEISKLDLVNLQNYSKHPFNKIIVKVRSHLVSMGMEVDLTKRGQYIEPVEWGKMIFSDYLVLDVRNCYEYNIGHFKGACNISTNFFRDCSNIDCTNYKKNILVYCTGGIRCEFFSAYLVQKGFNVFQLKGGVLNYGNVMGNLHWSGKLFVFDDRISVPISDNKHSLISSCCFCNKPFDVYHNCSNVLCNKLFLGCKECLLERNGCCSLTCQKSKAIRKLEILEDRPLPSRKMHYQERLLLHGKRVG